MDSVPTRIIAAALLLVQGVVAMAAGRTIHIPLADCTHRSALVVETTSCDGGCCEGHHRHHGGHVHASWGDAPDQGHRHDSDHPSGSLGHDSHCGCHVHLPVPDHAESIHSTTGVQAIALDRRAAATWCSDLRPLALPRPSGPRARVAWLRSDQRRALDVTSLQV